MNFEYIFLGVYVFVNLVALSLVFYDKRLSERRGEVDRIPEGVILFMASILGGVGIYLGMFLFRHKTRKWYFQIGVPLFIVQNLSVIYFLREFIN